MGAQAGAIYLGMHLIIENFLTLLPTIILAESAGTKASPMKILLESLKRLLKTPLILGLIVGLIFSMIGIKLPEALDKFFGMISITAAPISLFVIGGTLYGVKLTANLSEAFLISFGKLVAFPAAVMGAMMFFPGLSNEAKAAALLMACCPPPSFYSILCKQYGRADETANNVVISTLLSFFSLTVGLTLCARNFELSL